MKLTIGFLILWGALSSVSHAGNPKVGFEFAGGFTQVQQATLRNDLKELKSLQIESNDPWFQKTFGGTNASRVYSYLDERINYFIPWTADITGSVWPAAYFPPPMEVRDSNGKVIAALAAYNLSADLFFVNMRYWYDFSTVYSLTPFQRLNLDNMRVGLIEIGPRYFERINPAQPNQKMPTSRIERMAFLVHEARHSDCTGGLNDQDLDRVRAKRPIENQLCGYAHVKCPAGHKYEGVEACEDMKWGAYAVESLFLSALINSCANCTAAEKAEAQILFEDRKSRVLNWDQLTSGQRGNPDMSSGGPPWSSGSF